METISRGVAVFLVNALWQVPLLALAAALAARLMRSAPARYQYILWLAALGLSVALPIASLRVAGVATRADAQTTQSRGGMATQALAAPNSDSNLQAAERSTTTLRAAPFVDPAAPSPALGPFRLPAIPVSREVARFVAFGFALFLLLRAGRLVRAWRRALAIRGNASVRPLPKWAAEIVRRLQSGFGVAAIPILFSREISSPLTLGARTPAIILPEGFMERTAPDQLAAALAHEIAHVARRDYLLNLLAELVALPISFHPAAGLIRRRIRETREFAADELAAARLGAPSTYARSLVAIAESLAVPPSGQPSCSLGLFDTDQLEVRVMRLLNSCAHAPGRAAKALLVAGSLLLGAAFMTAARLPISVVQTGAAATTASFEPFIGAWRMTVSGKGETEIKLVLLDGKLAGSVTAYRLGDDENGEPLGAARVKTREWQITAGRVEDQTLDLSGQDDEGTSREFRIHLLSAKEAEFRVVGAPPPPAEIGEESPRPKLVKVDTVSAFAGTWVARFEGKTYIIVSLKPNGDAVGGSVSLGNFGVDADGRVNHVQDEPNPDYAEPIVSSRLEGDTLTIEAKTRKGGTNSFQMKLVEAGQAKIKWSSAAPEPVAPEPGWWTVTRTTDKAENEVMPGGPSASVVGGVPGGVSGGVPGGAEGQTRRIEETVKGGVSSAVSGEGGTGEIHGAVSGTAPDPSGARPKATPLEAVNVVRLINTAEADYKFKMGKYANWRDMLNSPIFRKTLARTQDVYRLEKNALARGPEVIPGYQLRLVVSPAGDHYVLSLEEVRVKECATFFYSDDRGLIQEGKNIGCSSSSK